MKKIKTHIDGLFVIKNPVFKDERGSFIESWNKTKFNHEELSDNFNQDNISFSKKNVIRGLHFQNQPYGQTKFVRVLQGKVIDIAVDIRKKSKTFGEYFSIELSEKNNEALWIPSGFAHGFLTLSKNNVFIYKCSGAYNPSEEYTIKWDDPDIGVKWNIKKPIVSNKDQQGMSLQEYKDSKLINA